MSFTVYSIYYSSNGLRKLRKFEISLIHYGNGLSWLYCYFDLLKCVVNVAILLLEVAKIIKIWSLIKRKINKGFQSLPQEQYIGATALCFWVKNVFFFFFFDVPSLWNQTQLYMSMTSAYMI